MEATNAQNTINFQVGKTYLMSWIGDSELKTPFTVISRTKCFIVLKSNTGETVRVKTYFYNEIESCMPMGVYSMAPVLRADRLVVESVQNIIQPAGAKIVSLFK